VTVVGGGIGGLPAAAFLAGADVCLLERNDWLGAHASTIEADGFTFDAGPSWYLMPNVFERSFARFDREPGDYYGLERLDPQHRVLRKDGDRVTVRPDVDDVATTFERYEDGAGAALRQCLAADSTRTEGPTRRGSWPASSSRPTAIAPEPPEQSARTAPGYRSDGDDPTRS